MAVLPFSCANITENHPFRNLKVKILTSTNRGFILFTSNPNN